EWEYACRARVAEVYDYSCGGRTFLESYAAFNARNTSNVGHKMCNSWGLYDMHGNILEWCHDWYGKDYSDDAVNPVGPSKGWQKVHRGGSAGLSATDCRSSVREKSGTKHTNGGLGFRVALALSDESMNGISSTESSDAERTTPAAEDAEAMAER
ncbi:MAG: SUMF1/EgtB/PvdO family nonheme iron enzyme, partial [Planctomycetales bacterium]|nr:SUMF1/EgtB/PvdO family nonheme iron enzyme [Planctomycetales bacterium]